MSEFVNMLATYQQPEIPTIDPLDELYHSDFSEVLDQVPKTNTQDILSSLLDTVTDRKTRKFPIIKSNKSSDTDDISFPDLLKEENINARISSGYRPNAVTNTGKKSNHAIEGGAYDIVPTNGKSWEDLRKEIYSNKRIRDWMNKKGWGIIEEVSDADRKKYGASGANWHFGPDSAAVENWRNNLIKYGENGFKFEDTLASNKLITPQLSIDKLTLFKNILTDNSLDIDDYSPYLYSNEKDTKSRFPIIKKKIQSDSTTKQYSGTIPSLIYNQIPDSEKADTLVQIAKNESDFNVNAKNPTSSASGLFGFIDSTKQQFGYGNTAESQIEGASKYYDYLNDQVKPYINRYGNRGLNMRQIMYGMWFRPKSMLNYLVTGTDSYRDAQGTSLQTILHKMS